MIDQELMVPVILRSNFNPKVLDLELLEAQVEPKPASWLILIQ